MLPGPHGAYPAFFPQAHSGRITLNPASFRSIAAASLLVPKSDAPKPYPPSALGAESKAFLARASFSHELPGISVHFASFAYLSDQSYRPVSEQRFPHCSDQNNRLECARQTI